MGKANRAGEVLSVQINVPFPWGMHAGAGASCPEMVGMGTCCISVRLRFVILLSPGAYLLISWPLSSLCARQGSWAQQRTAQAGSVPVRSISTLICFRRAEGRSSMTGSRLTQGPSMTLTLIPATRSRWKLTSSLLIPRFQVPCPLSADLTNPCSSVHMEV